MPPDLEIYLLTTILAWEKQEKERRAQNAGANGIFDRSDDSQQILDLVRQQEDRTVAVVDDTAFSRQALTDFLEIKKAKIVYQFENPVDALASFPTLSPPVEIVFSDVNMPRMDGFEFTRRLREEERNQT